MPELRGVERLLWRLDGVRRTGEQKWIARCPAHEDRDPSLSIGVGRDGRALIHCHAGCGAADVVAAVGLRMGDLFPDGAVGHHAGAMLRRREERAYHEAVVEIATNDRRAGKALTKADRLCAAESARWLAKHPVTEEWMM